MRTRYITASLVALVAGTISLNAQTPQTPRQTRPQPNPPSQRPMTDDRQPPSTTAGSQQTITVTGCLKEEKDVPGRNQSVAVRGHMDNDYVLTNVKMAEGSSTSGIGLATMYEIKGLDSELKGHLGHQIQVTGTLESNAGRTGNTTGGANSTADITDLHGASVKMLSQTCTAAQ